MVFGGPKTLIRPGPLSKSAGRTGWRPGGRDRQMPDFVACGKPELGDELAVPSQWLILAKSVFDL
jgi:hypothetical protein